MHTGVKVSGATEKSELRQCHLIAYCATVACVSLVSWRPLALAFSEALRSDQYSYILMVLPISILLIVREWPRLNKLVRFDPLAGLSLLALGAISGAFLPGWMGESTAAKNFAAEMCALVLSWWGASLLCLGWRASRCIAFPLLLLLGIIPIPVAVMDAAQIGLRQSSAWMAAMMFSASGVAVIRDGFILSIPGLSVDVAPQCSSIHSSMILVLTAAVLAHILLRRKWKKILLVAISIPMCAVKNGFRIYLIALLTAKVDPGYMNSRLHHQGGFVFFGLALLALGAILWALRRGDSLAESASSS